MAEIIIEQFWDKWKNKTEIEKRAIISINMASNILFETIPQKKIYAVYIKGSFIRREMNEKSDVDIVPIVYDNKTLEKVQKLEKARGQEYCPSELLPNSLQEFEQGKRHLKHRSPKSGVDGTLRNLYQYKLVYGKPIDITRYPMRSDAEFLKGHIKAFNTTFIPLYEQNKLDFSQLIKQIFFLVEREERMNGIVTDGSWVKLAKSIKDKNHIIHDALRYRLHPTDDSAERTKLLKKLELYLETLKKYN